MTTVAINVLRDDLITSNSRLSRWDRARRVKELRQQGFWQTRFALGAGKKLTGPQTCTISVAWPPLKRRRDSLNVEATIKPTLDGMVDYGLLLDDSDQYLTEVTIRPAGGTCLPRYGCTLTFDFRAADHVGDADE